MDSLNLDGSADVIVDLRPIGDMEKASAIE
jgi:hypothetical protein